MSLLQQDVTPDSIKAAFAVASLPEEAAADYIADVDETQLAHVVGQVVSDRVFRLPAQELLDAHCEAGGTGFHYEFTWTSPNPPFAGLSIHGLDLPFEFDLLDADGIALLHGTNAPQQLASTLHEAWVGFIKDQDPGWPTYDTTTRISKIFDTENNLRNDIFADLRGRWAGVDTGYRRWR
jgi:para-nitrobenzyl esterase